MERRSKESSRARHIKWKLIRLMTQNWGGLKKLGEGDLTVLPLYTLQAYKDDED